MRGKVLVHLVREGEEEHKSNESGQVNFIPSDRLLFKKQTKNEFLSGALVQTPSALSPDLVNCSKPEKKPCNWWSASV